MQIYWPRKRVLWRTYSLSYVCIAFCVRFKIHIQLQQVKRNVFIFWFYDTVFIDIYVFAAAGVLCEIQFEI